MTRLVLTDLDDTLFATARHHDNLDGCVPVTFKNTGEPSGYQSVKQQAIWSWLQSFGEIVPVTSRGKEQLDRVTLPFSPHGIWNHGLTIRIHGQEDLEWRGRSRALLMPLQDVLHRLTTEIPAALGWSVEDVHVVETPDLDNLTRQVGFKGPNIASYKSLLQEMLSLRFGPDLFWVHTHPTDRIYITPVGVGKELAVDYLIEKIKPEMTVGFGDNPSDIAFMQRCDLSLFPKHCFALRAP